jgi:hypothetical protein
MSHLYAYYIEALINLGDASSIEIAMKRFKERYIKNGDRHSDRTPPVALTRNTLIGYRTERVAYDFRIFITSGELRCMMNYIFDEQHQHDVTIIVGKGITATRFMEHIKAVCDEKGMLCEVVSYVVAGEKIVNEGSYRIYQSPFGAVMQPYAKRARMSGDDDGLLYG